MSSLPTVEQDPFDSSGLRNATRISMEAPVIFTKLLQLALDNEADYLNILLTIMEQMVALKKANANGRIIINAGTATGGKDRGRRLHSLELRIIVKKYIEILDIYQKP
jgi:hypothetical protein